MLESRGPLDEWARELEVTARSGRAHHEPEKTLLYEMILAELVPFLGCARSQGAPVARFVVREIRVYLGRRPRPRT